MVSWCSVALAQSSLPECEGADYNKRTNCHGTMTWSDGGKYVGEFKNRKLHGQGTHTRPDGYKYVGEFKNNQRHGQGTATYADGRIEKGNWKKGKIVRSKKEKAEAREDENIAKAQNVCRKVGLTPGTDKFIDCTIKMLTTTGGKQTVIVGQQRTLKTIYPLHCRQMGGMSDC